MSDDLIVEDERAGLPSASFDLIDPCDGAWNLIQALKAKGVIPCEESSAAAESGTRIHLVLTEGIVKGLSNYEREFAERCREILGELVFGAYPEFRVHAVEQRLWLRRGLTRLFSGRYDMSYGDEGLLAALLIDIKSGRVEVDPAYSNSQMRNLAALWHFNYPQTERLDVAIIQPRISVTPSVARFERADMVQALEHLQTRLRAIAEPDAPRSPGIHCQYCPANIHCPEAKEFALTSPKKLLEQIESGEIQLPLGARGALAISAIMVGERILKKLKERYFEEISKNPDVVPGWKISNGARYFEFTDYKKAREILAKEIPEEILDQASDFTLEPLKKAYFAVNPNLVQKEALSKFCRLLTPAIVWKQKKGSLRPLKGAPQEQIED